MRWKVLLLIAGFAIPLGVFAVFSSQAEGPPREEGCYQETFGQFGGPQQDSTFRGDGRTSDQVVLSRSEYSDTKLYERRGDRATYMKTDGTGRILKRVDVVHFGGTDGQWAIEHTMISMPCDEPSPSPR